MAYEPPQPVCGRALPTARGVRTMCARIGCPADGLASPSCAKSNAAGGGRGVDCEHTRWSCEEHESSSFLPLPSDVTLAACSASLAHALQEPWRARVWESSLCLACSDPFTIKTMPGPQKSHTGSGSGPSKPRNRQMSQPTSPPRAGPSPHTLYLHLSRDFLLQFRNLTEPAGVGFGSP